MTKPIKQQYFCPSCGSDNVWIAGRVNPNTGYHDWDPSDVAGCYASESEQCESVTEAGQLLESCGKCDECMGGNWCRELPQHPDDNDNDND